MANLVDIFAEVGASMIGDDSSPTLTLKNSSTGSPLNLVGEKTTSGEPLTVSSIAAGALVNAVVSGASGTVLKLTNIEKSYTSTNSTASLSFAMRVDVGGVIYYMPVYLGKA